MSLHPQFPSSPYAPLIPAQRWFPADEALRSTAYEKLLPPLVAKMREEVYAWRNKGYAGASPTSVALLRHWFEAEHLTENADGSLSTFRYYFAQREAVETVIWLYEVRRARDKFDLLRFDASGAVSSRHVRRRLAALRPENGDRRGQNQGPLAAHRVEFLPQALRAGLRALAQLSRHRAQHHRARPPPRRLRRPQDFLQRPHPARQRPRGAQLARRFPGHAPHPGRRPHRARHRQFFPHEHPPRFPRRRPRPVAGRRGPARLFPRSVRPKARRAKPPTAKPTSAKSSARSKNWPCSTTRPTTSTTSAWRGSSPSRTFTIGCSRKTAAWRLQVDVTATPRHDNGAIFVQTVSDYPLVEAIHQNVVKHPVLPDAASRAKLQRTEKRHLHREIRRLPQARHRGMEEELRRTRTARQKSRPVRHGGRHPQLR